MMHHHDAVGRRMNVQFERVGPALERPLERRKRVLGELALCATMGDALEVALRQEHGRVYCSAAAILTSGPGSPRRLDRNPSPAKVLTAPIPSRLSSAYQTE